MDVSIEAVWVTLATLIITGLVYFVFDYGFNFRVTKEVKR